MNSNPISDKQLNFLLSLRVERGMEGAISEDDLRKLSSYDASATIKQMLALPKVATSTTAPKLDHGIPAGRYAIEQDGVLKFYRVDCPSEGKWAGYIFVKVQASDTLYPVKGLNKEDVLTAIMQDPASAAKRYGQEIGKCGVCGRTLTDETSRAYGIGPDCRSNTGW